MLQKWLRKSIISMAYERQKAIDKLESLVAQLTLHILQDLLISNNEEAHNHWLSEIKSLTDNCWKTTRSVKKQKTLKPQDIQEVIDTIIENEQDTWNNINDMLNKENDKRDKQLSKTHNTTIKLPKSQIHYWNSIIPDMLPITREILQTLLLSSVSPENIRQNFKIETYKKLYAEYKQYIINKANNKTIESVEGIY